jgi:AAA domain
MATAATTLLNAEEYAKHIRQLAVRRGLIKVCETATNAAYGVSQGAELNGELVGLRQQLDILDREAAPLNGSALVMLADCTLDLEAFYLVDGLLPRCNMAVAYGYGGCGKTYLWTSLAIGIGSGRWFMHETEPGAVLYVAFERPRDAEDRLAALREELGCDALPIGLLKLGGKRFDDQMAPIILQAARELAEQSERPVRAIVVDTVSAALGGLREDDEGLGTLRRHGEHLAVETGAIVVWIHHEGKTEGRGPRGALQLADACSVWWRLEEREDGSRVVHVEKANRGPCHQALFAFRLVPFTAGRDDKDRDIQLCKLELVALENALASPVRRRFDAKPDKGEPRLGDRQTLFMRILRNLADKQPDGVERAVLKSHFVLELNAGRAEPLKPDGAGSIFRQALASLRKRELVTEDGDLIAPAAES